MGLRWNYDEIFLFLLKILFHLQHTVQLLVPLGWLLKSLKMAKINYYRYPSIFGYPLCTI